MRWVCPADGVYYAEVRGYGSGTGTFSLSVLALGRRSTPQNRLLPNSAPLRLRTACFLGSAEGSHGTSCSNQLHEEHHRRLQATADAADTRELGSGSTFTLTLDAIAGATFVLDLAIDADDSAFGCQDVGRGDGLAEAYCSRAHCPDFAAGTPTAGMCDASCGYCSARPSEQGLYASITIFPEHAVGGSGAAGKVRK